MSMMLELSDLCFFVKSLKLHESPNQSFNIFDHVFFSHNNTRSGTFNKLVQPPIKHNRDKQFYFKRLPHLWNALPPMSYQLIPQWKHMWYTRLIHEDICLRQWRLNRIVSVNKT